MAYNNNINYAAIFNRILDEKFYIMPRTLWMENTDPSIQWEGGKEIKIPYLEMDGLGDMQGYKAPDGWTGKPRCSSGIVAAIWLSAVTKWT